MMSISLKRVYDCSHYRFRRIVSQNDMKQHQFEKGGGSSKGENERVTNLWTESRADDFIEERFIQETLELLIGEAASHRYLRLQEVIGPVAQDVEILSGIVSSGSALVLSKLHIQYPVQLVLNSPMTAFCFQNLTCSHTLSPFYPPCWWKNLRRFDEQHRQFRHIPKVIKESYLNQKHPTNSKVECVFFCSGYSQASTIYFKSTIQKQLQPRKIRPKSFIDTKEKG